MKKWVVILVSSIIFILGGCTIGEKSKDVTPTPNVSLQKDGIELGRPDGLFQTGVVAFTPKYSKHCWEDGDQSCSFEPFNPTRALEDGLPTKSGPGEIVKLELSADSNSNVPQPDDYRVFLYADEDDPGTTIDVIDNKITVPEEKGEYYYTVIAEWNKDVKGEAVFIFSVSVKP